MADCPGTLGDLATLPGFVGDPLNFDDPVPATEGPVTYTSDIEDTGGGFYIASTSPTMATALTMRFRFTDPGTIPEPPFDLPPGFAPLMPYVAAALLTDEGDTSPETVVASTTVHDAPVGADVQWFTDTPMGITLTVLAGVGPMPAGEYDVEVTLTFAPIAGPVAFIAAAAWAGPMTVVSWSWECEPAPPEPEPIMIPPVDCLGSGVYTMDIVRRPTVLGPGGPFLPGDDLELLGGNWTRKLGTSTAGVTFAADSTCCESIAAMMDLAVLELELYRDDSEGTRRTQLVWAGPVTDLLDNRDGTFLLTAADVSYYVTDERVAGAHVWTAEDLAVIFADVITDALAVDNPGISIVATPTGIRGDRSIAAGDAKPVGQVLGEITRTAVDWTVVGREWRVGGQQIDRATILPIQLHDEHFANPPKIRISRSAMATRQLVRGNGVVGSAGGARDDGVLIEKVADENGIIDQASADAAAATLWDRVHEPVTVIEGTSEARLDADAPIDLQTLIPGIGVPVSVGDCLTYVGLMRLESVSVDFGTTENVAIALQPVGTGALS